MKQNKSDQAVMNVIWPLQKSLSVAVIDVCIREWLDGRVMCGNRSLIWETWNSFPEFTRGFQHGIIKKFTVFAVECFQTRNIKVMLHSLVWLCLLQVFTNIRVKWYENINIIIYRLYIAWNCKWNCTKLVQMPPFV
jgi:hypothetical protein